MVKKPLFTVTRRPNTYISIPIISKSYFRWNLRVPIVRGLIPPEEASTVRHWDAVIMPKFHLKRLSHDRRETWSENRKSREWRWERSKTTDFHQNRLSNQMGTIRELGQSGWEGLWLDKSQHKPDTSFRKKWISKHCCHVILNGFQ